MDAIILAGGKGTRMRPLTKDTPKPLLEVQGRPILEWSLLNLRPVADRAIIVVNYLKEQIAAYMARQTIFEDYALVEQLPEPLGTGHALQCCRPELKSEDFIVINGDDLFSRRGIAALAAVPLGLLTVLRDDATQYGVAVTDEADKVLRLHEKPAAGTYPPPVRVNIGAYKFDQRIFDYDLPRSERGEYEITDYVSWLAERAPMRAIVTDFWEPVGKPQDLERAQTLDLGPLKG